MRFRIGLLLTGMCLCSAVQAADRPWQQIQMPTAAQMQAAWNNPPPEYGPEPYYGMNGPITRDVIRRDLDTMKASGWRAVTVEYGSGGGYDYLSPQHMAIFKQFVAEAKKRDMRVWIVDDAGYPSGFAGGRFSNQRPELRMQVLQTAKTLTIDGGISVDEAVPADTVAVSAIPTLSGDAVSLPVANGRVRWTAPVGSSWSIYFVNHAFRTSPTRSDTNPTHAKDESQSLEDYMDPAATAQYLAFTHEVYKQAVGAEFGKTILGFRGDEPDYTVAGLPWTPKFFDTFQKEKGYDIRPYLAAFLQPRGAEFRFLGKQASAHADYYDVFAQMFRDGFFKPQADWCAQNGLEYQVHLNHEEQQLHLVQSEGDFFRDMRYVQVPGIDTIWHQIWTDTVSDFPRLSASASHIYGHPRNFTESYAAYRPTPDITIARYIINEQMVRGVNLIETMHYSASGTPRGGPAAYMKDPGWPALMAYTRRLSYLLSMGRPDASVALLLPTASFWFGDANADNSFVSSERLLSEHQIDFDIVTEDAINETLKLQSGKLESASGNQYGALIVPQARILSRTTVDKLKAFVAGGGHVLFIGGPPGMIAERAYLNQAAAKPEDFSGAVISPLTLQVVPTPPGAPPATAPGPLDPPAELLTALNAVVPEHDMQLSSPDTAVRYMQRKLKDATVLTLFNESGNSVHNGMLLSMAGRDVERWNPESGSISPVAVTGVAGKLSAPLDLEPYSMAVFLVH